MQRGDVVEMARGRWPALLLRLGVSRDLLNGRNQPCPDCGGVDRFRFTDFKGEGRWVCSQHGHGNGFDLLRIVHGWDFKRAAQEIRGIVGDVPVSTREPVNDEQMKEKCREVWKQSRPVAHGDLVSLYLALRGIHLDEFPKALRMCPSLTVDRVERPAMIALVSDAKGVPHTIHRTFLAADGSSKADMASPRRMMPGSVPKGGAIRLFEVTDHVGIAEGIETALAAHKLFGIPVWSALNTVMMTAWEPPASITSVTVYGDNDLKLGGQSAAYELAHKLAVRGIDVRVCIPEAPGDWNDVLVAQRRAA